MSGPGSPPIVTLSGAVELPVPKRAEGSGTACGDPLLKSGAPGSGTGLGEPPRVTVIAGWEGSAWP
jgi:hypothetical protein